MIHLDVPHAGLDVALVGHRHELRELIGHAGRRAAGARRRATALRAGLRTGARTRGFGRGVGAATPLRVVRDGAVGGQVSVIDRRVLGDGSGSANVLTARVGQQVSHRVLGKLRLLALLVDERLQLLVGHLRLVHEDVIWEDMVSRVSRQRAG